MRYLTINQVLGIYHRVMQQSSGLIGIRDLCIGIGSDATARDLWRRRIVFHHGGQGFCAWLLAHSEWCGTPHSSGLAYSNVDVW